jgi:predicted SnoaL-like aldol condensation-catalyzing enzyme
MKSLTTLNTVSVSQLTIFTTAITKLNRQKMKQLLLSTAILIGVGFSACTNQNNSNAQNQTKEKMETSNKQKVVALLKSIETGDSVPVSYVNPDNYIQHNLGTANGLAGFGALLSTIPKGSAKVNSVRAFEDGDLVFTHTDYNFFGPKIGFDIFRFEGGKIVEHWDNLQETAKPNPSGHTMIDGATEINDLGKTEANKTLVRSFVEDILVNGKMEKLASYFDGDNYIQHSPTIPDQLSGLGATLDKLAKQGVLLKYDKVHKVLGEGNFVLVVSEGHFGKDHNAFYDLFRVESSKIAEHWDVIEPIPVKANWKNNNGKF